MPEFEAFSRRLLQFKADPQITILRRGTMSLNKSAYAALDFADAVELLYDAGSRIVGLRPISPRAENSYLVRPATTGGSGPFVITAMAFTKFYGIDTTCSLRRSAYLEDDVLCVGLDDAAIPVTSNRARSNAIDSIAAADAVVTELGEARSV